MDAPGRVAEQRGGPLRQRAGSAFAAERAVLPAALHARVPGLVAGAGRAGRASSGVVERQHLDPAASRAGRGGACEPQHADLTHGLVQDHPGALLHLTAVTAGRGLTPRPAHPPSCGRRILARIGRRSPMPGPVSVPVLATLTVSTTGWSRSFGSQSKRSHNAARTSMFTRCGVLVTRRCTNCRDRWTSRSASIGTRSLVWKMPRAAMTWRRFHCITIRLVIADPPVRLVRRPV